MRHHSELLEYLRRGGMVLAANARASRGLERDFALDQQERGYKAWAAPAIATWQLWLDQLWQQYVFNSDESRLVLSNIQERNVWRRIVARDPRARLVMSSESLAALAHEAYALLGDYGAHSYRKSSWTWNSFDDGAAFRSWADAFDRECRENHWLSRSRLASELAFRIADKTVTVADEIRTLGFDRFTPAQQQFFDTSGCSIVPSQQTANESLCSLYAATDTASELLECAYWLRGRLLKNPAERLAVIVTNPQKIRGELERVLRKVLMPRSMYLPTWYLPASDTSANSQFDTVTVTEGGTASAFEFSLGVAVGKVPVIHAALLLLRWLIDPLRQEQISWLLLSGFVSGAEGNSEELAQLDANIRARALLPPEVELDVFLKQRGYAKANSDRLFQRLDRYADGAVKSGVMQRSRPAMEWAEAAPALLALAGWPGSKPQSSLRFQALSKWEELLTQLASLSFDGTRMTYREFVRIMEEVASRTLFAPQSQDASVQIVGAFESSGQTFDALWFVGVDEDGWPAQGGPSPFIPLAIQRAVGMPHATPDIDWELARTATQRIASSAPECIFSYAKQNPAGDLRISPLMSEVAHLRALEQTLVPEINVTATVAIEEVEESAPVPWPREKVAGGSGVLTSQSACAFQAFAGRRLFAVDPESSEWGLNALARGVLMHGVLQRLWSGEQGLGSLDGLETAIAEHEIEPFLDEKIAETFANHPATRAPEGWIRAYLEVEKIRIKRLLLQWLEYEQRRQPFEVEACEKEISDLRVGDLRLRVRLDRIDVLPDGTKLLIDYKTGEVSTGKWACPRPEEPQLPLYATFGNLGEVSGILFAQIRAGSTRFEGHVKDVREVVISTGKTRNKLAPLTDEEKEGWRVELLRLADDFLGGEASVAPKNYPKTCTYCGMQGLCRVAVTDVPFSALDIDEDENGMAQAE